MGSRLVVHVDNQGDCFCAASGSSKNFGVQCLAQLLHKLSGDNYFEPYYAWVHGSRNTVADKGSRATQDLKLRAFEASFGPLQRFVVAQKKYPWEQLMLFWQAYRDAFQRDEKRPKAE